MTLQKIEGFAHDFNKAYFNDELDLSKVKFLINTRLTRTRGRCRYVKSSNTYEVQIGHLLLPYEVETRSTLLHELIHVWQRQKGKGVGHDRSFHRKASDIRRISEGKFNIRTRASAQVAEYAQVIEKVLAPKEQWLIHKDGKYNFLRKIHDSEMKLLKELAFDVYKVLKPVNVSHAKNLDYALKMRSYYPECRLPTDLKLQEV